MIPISGVRAKTPFPYVGLATAVLLLHAILVAVVPPNPYRAVFALAALFAVGYCTLALIVGATIRLTAAEILAFSTGLTIFITSLSALGVSILGIPITVFAVVIVGLPIALLASLVLRPRGNGRVDRRRLHGSDPARPLERDGERGIPHRGSGYSVADGRLRRIQRVDRARARGNVEPAVLDFD